MSIPILCVLVAWLLIYLPRWLAVKSMHAQPGGYNNRNPRRQQKTLSGWPQRAINAHNNGFEAFAPFGAAVAISLIREGDPMWMNGLCIAFVVCRSVYIGSYIADMHVLRSTAWTGAFAAIGGLLCLAMVA